MTWLKIQRHNVTGLKYLHKTDRASHEDYLGSGLHWKRHLNKHGRNVTTVWKKWFEKDEVEEFALFVSEVLNIVESDEWSNMKPENGKDGGSDGIQFRDRIYSIEERNNTRKRMKNNNPMHNSQIRQNHAMSMQSTQRKLKISHAKKGNTNVRGRSWYNNGNITKMFYPNDVPVDFVPGRLNPHWNHMRKNNV